MNRSTERLLWIGGLGAIAVGGVAALALSSKKTTTTPQGGQGGTQQQGGGLILPRGIVINIIPQNGVQLSRGLVLPNWTYQAPGQPARAIQSFGADYSGPWAFTMLPGDSLVIAVPNWQLTQEANPDVLIREPAGQGFYAYIANDNVDLTPNAGKSTDILFTSGAGWNLVKHRFYAYVGTLAQ